MDEQDEESQRTSRKRVNPRFFGGFKKLHMEKSLPSNEFIKYCAFEGLRPTVHVKILSPVDERAGGE